MKEEMDFHEKNKTWDLVELPNDRKVVGYKWVYKLKKYVDGKVERYKVGQDVDGKVVRYKSRMVPKGYS